MSHDYKISPVVRRRPCWRTWCRHRTFLGSLRWLGDYVWWASFLVSAAETYSLLRCTARLARVRHLHIRAVRYQKQHQCSFWSYAFCIIGKRRSISFQGVRGRHNSAPEVSVTLESLVKNEAQEAHRHGTGCLIRLIR